MAYYSPFVDRSGNQLRLSQVRYSHLSQLREIDEGYKVEYKSKWDNSVKRKHLVKTISSFSNTEGGWLFVGINDDGTISPIEKGRADFGHQVGQIIKSSISPSPLFETKFVSNPNDKKTGVLIIYVNEGTDPPYICNGTVYTRIGSNKEPIRISHRSEIDHLINKRNNFNAQLDKFFVDNVINSDGFPYCVVYMYNRRRKMDNFINIVGDKSFIQEIAMTHNFKPWMTSEKSVLFFNSEPVSASSITPVFELFLDYSMKLHIPLPTLPENLKNRVSTNIKSRNSLMDIKGFTAVDGFLSHKAIEQMFLAAYTILLENKIMFENYVVKAELHNIHNCFLFFSARNGMWYDFMCSNNFRYSPKDNANPFALSAKKLRKKDLSVDSWTDASYCLALPFGFMIDEYFKLLTSNDDVVKAHFPNGSYTGNEYYLQIFNTSY